MGELDAKMTVREFRDWQLFEQDQPLPDKLGDLQNALLCVVATNIMRSGDTPPAQLADFLILKPPAEPETARYDDSPQPVTNEGEAFKRALRGT